jgi:murein L,D-transpeptidase YafK
VGSIPASWVGELQHGMGIGLRRISTCLRVCALVTAGIGVAHGSAIRANATEQAGQAAEPTGSIALPEEKAPSDAAGLVGEQRAAKAARTLLPANRMASLTQKGLAAGDAVMIRIFKAESELELWMQKDDRFELFTTYSICKWSGKLGPKQHEGDRQAPEGMYAVGMPQIHRKGRWPRALNIGYPNAFDRAMDRTGSYILVHGGCSSTGCFAMTNQQMEEIYRLSEEALKQGQTHIPIHVFPFRMTETNLKAYSDSRWQSFWRNLKDAYDVFERTRVPPQVSVCGKRYVVREGGSAAVEQASSVGTDPFDRAECIDTGAEVARMVSADDDDEVQPAKISRARKVVSKTQRRRSAGRNARKAYAAARRARVAAHSARMRSAARTER